MRKKILLILVLLLMSLGLGMMSFAQEVSNMKKVVMIIPSDAFRDEELSQTKEVLEAKGIEVKIASTTLKEVKGMLGAKAKPDILVNDVNARDFDAVVFIGGVGASQYWDDPVAHQLAQDALNNNRIVAAICIAPVTLAKAGILNGKRATVWSSEASQLKAQGANYTGRPVEKDGNIITASGPAAARDFGQVLAEALLNR
jgi:protease I